MTILLTAEQVAQFQDEIYRYYCDARRDLPYRNCPDPYGVLVSEVMLQQTQVERVNRKYPDFMAEFPDFPSLAAAALPALLHAWQGMGYNRRAKYLKAIAEKVVNKYGGVLPEDPDILVTFPGIGRATAGSIVAFAFNIPVIFIETNIRRVFLHRFFPGLLHVADKEILPLVEQTLDCNAPREWYYALMDYGTHLKETVPNPNRRSRHYTRQSSFTGSDRQIRGQVLRVLLEEPGTRIADMPLKTGCAPERLEKVLQDLEREQFLVRDKGSLYIA